MKERIPIVGKDDVKFAILSTGDGRVTWYKLFGGKVDNIKKQFSLKPVTQQFLGSYSKKTQMPKPMFTMVS